MRVAAEVLMDVLRDEGVTHVFGNPGSTELALLDQLDGSELRYVLGLQEVAVVGMADGYAQASGRPAFVNLHTLGGLGHAAGAIASARITRAPMVVTAGNQDRRHLSRDAWLSGDLEAVAAPIAKSSREVRLAADLPLLLRRAFRDAMTPPRGPVFLSLPMDILEEEIDAGPGRKSAIHQGGAPDVTRNLATRIASTPPGRFALLLGDEVWQTPGAAEAAVMLANATGAAVFGAPLCVGCVFPSAHNAWRGQLFPETSWVRLALDNFDLVVGVGGRLLHAYHYEAGAFLPDSTTFAHITAEADVPGRSEVTEFGLVGNVASILNVLAAECGGNAAAIPEFMPSETDCLLRDLKPDWLGFGADTVVNEILRALPPGTPVVNEACCALNTARRQMAMMPGQYFFIGAGHLGWAMPASVGVSLARSRSPVVCLVGDGGAMYAPQALWSANREGVPVVFVVLDNREYGLLKEQARLQGLPKATKGQFLGMDMDPCLDFCALATSMGVPSVRAATPAAIGEAVHAAIRQSAPSLIHVPLD